MAGFFKGLSNTFSYKESKAKEKFELLENKDYDQKLGTEKGETKNNSRDANASQETSVSPDASKNAFVEKEKQLSKLKVVQEIDRNIYFLKKEFNISKNEDVIIREFRIGRKYRAFIAYLDGMVNTRVVNEDILRQLMNCENFQQYDNNSNLLDYISKDVLAVKLVSKFKDIEELIWRILNGDTAIFIDEYNEALLCETRGFEKRAIDKPSTETVIRGSQEAFNENMRTNITLIRRIVKNRNLISETIQLGSVDKSECTMLYIDGIANMQIVNEVKRRLKSIEADMVMGDGMIEQYIEDSPYALFSQVLSTERPDRAASFLIDGKVVIVSEGSPFVCTVPVTFFHFFHTSEEYFLRWQYGSFLRMIRVLGLIVSIFLPGLYVATVLYRHEILPTNLLNSIAQSRETVPFPTIIELMMMELAFELVREAGVRMPGVIGQTLGIIGALILGQAAVAAKLVTPILIIVVAVAGLGSFAIPNYPLGIAFRISRFIFIFLGALSGYLGIGAGFFLLAVIVCNMKSFGVPFFAPIAPKAKKSPDIVIRQPIFKAKERADFMNSEKPDMQAEKSSYYEKEKSGGDNGYERG